MMSTTIGVEMHYRSRLNGYVKVTEMTNGWNATVLIVNRNVWAMTVTTDLDEAEEFFTEYYEQISRLSLKAWVESCPL